MSWDRAVELYLQEYDSDSDSFKSLISVSILPDESATVICEKLQTFLDKTEAIRKNHVDNDKFVIRTNC